MKNTFILILLALVFGITSCDINESDSFFEEYIVEAYLIAGETLPEVRLSTTVPFGTAYIFTDQAVTNANVRIERLDLNENVLEAFSYQMSGGPGIYRESGQTHMVQAASVYQLTVDIGGDIIRAQTFVPDTFRIVETNADTILYQGGEQLEFTVTPSFYPGRQNVFLFSTQAFDVRMDNLTPFQADIFDEEEDQLENLRINESPPVNEGNFEVNSDGTITIRLPWIAVNFYGRNLISANAIDQNMWDFVRSQEIQNGASTLSPGEIPNVVEYIEGGVGIFGSLARVSKEIFIIRPPNQ